MTATAPEAHPADDELALYESVVSRLESVATKRGEVSAVTLGKALDALEGVGMPAIRPAENVAPVFADGLPPCPCDGENAPGPWHRTGCARKTAA